MIIGVINGSPRQDSNSEKIAKYFESTIKAEKLASEVELFSLKNNPLEFWNQSFWDPNSESSKNWQPWASRLERCTSFVVISPEYGGMATACLKNFFTICGGSLLAHKPAMIVAVSSGEGGAYAQAELRMSSYKNNRICFIPDHMIIKRADDMLNGDNPAAGEDEHIRKRVFHSLKSLKRYDEALQTVRKNDDFDYKSFPLWNVTIKNN